MSRVATKALELPVLEVDEELTRADLVFYDVDHSGPSYEARVFLASPDADASTPMDAEHGYVGSFTVFGHDGCYGDPGHCDPDLRHRDEFDRRPPHPLTGFTRTVIATEAIRAAVLDPTTEAIELTVVAVVPGEPEGERDGAGPLRFSHVRLLTYEG